MQHVQNLMSLIVLTVVLHCSGQLVFVNWKEEHIFCRKLGTRRGTSCTYGRTKHESNTTNHSYNKWYKNIRRRKCAYSMRHEGAWIIPHSKVFFNQTFNHIINSGFLGAFLWCQGISSWGTRIQLWPEDVSESNTSYRYSNLLVIDNNKLFAKWFWRVQVSSEHRTGHK